MGKELDERVKRFGRRIKTLRESTPDVSQEALAAAVGYSRSAIANLETGRLDPVLSRAFALADYFKMPLAQLLSEQDQEFQRALSQEGRELLAIFQQFEEGELRMLRRCAKLLQQHQRHVLEHLDHQIGYIEDTLKLRRLQQGETDDGAGEDTQAS